jgi:hypothetical protein
MLPRLLDHFLIGDPPEVCIGVSDTRQTFLIKNMPRQSRARQLTRSQKLPHATSQASVGRPVISLTAADLALIRRSKTSGGISLHLINELITFSL